MTHNLPHVTSEVHPMEENGLVQAHHASKKRQSHHQNVPAKSSQVKIKIDTLELIIEWLKDNIIDCVCFFSGSI